MANEHDIVHDLLRINAVQLNPINYFTWTSGVKSPIYCDNRLIMSYPKIRKKVTAAFIDLLESKEWKPDVIAGCATAGIPHAAWLSQALDLPMVYVRSEPKGHGKGNQIEGVVERGASVLVIEDLISTGGSSIQAANVLEEEGMNVLGIAAIFSYGLKQAETNFKSAGFFYDTLTNFDRLLDALVAKNEVTEIEKTEMLNWRESL